MSSHTPAMWLAGILDEEMHRLRLKQDQVAVATGVSQAAVSKWVTGKNLPDPRQALRLAVLLERDPLDFLGRLWPEFNELDRLAEIRVLLADASPELIRSVTAAVRVAVEGSQPPPRPADRARRARGG